LGDRSQRVLTEIAQLNAASLSYVPRVLFLGGFAPAAELAVGTAYDLRFLDDRDARAAASPDHFESAAPDSITDQLTRLASMLEAGLLTRQ